MIHYLRCAPCLLIVGCSDGTSSIDPVHASDAGARLHDATADARVPIDGGKDAVATSDGSVAKDASPSKDVSAPSDATADTASFDAGSTEFFEVTINGVQRVKTGGSGTVISSGKYCRGYTAIDSSDHNLSVMIHEGLTTGTFGCAFYAFDKPSYSSYSGITGTCAATITTLGAIGSTIEGTVSGMAQASDKTLVPFSGSFRFRHTANSKCAEPAPPP